MRGTKKTNSIKTSARKGVSSIVLTDRDQTKILERQMLETMNKIDVGLSKRFNPKLIPLKVSNKSITMRHHNNTLTAFPYENQLPNFYSVDNDVAMKSI